MFAKKHTLASLSKISLLFVVVVFSACSSTVVNKPDTQKCSQTISAPGKLLIVGGALSGENEDVYRAFINALPCRDSTIAIIPAASGKPVKSAEKFSAILQQYGVSEDRISVFPLAYKDDPTTEYDETAWRENADNTELIKQFKNVGGVWFTGGDQMRIIDTICPDKQQETRLYKLLKSRLQNGAVIGGTSAGAAMMSNTMIAAGDSFTSLTTGVADAYEGMPSQDKGQLYLHHGLGFLPAGIVDQHFDRKARLGRLVRALTLSDDNVGFGVDEDTAMLVNLKTYQVKTLGTGNVTIVESRRAVSKQLPFSVKNISVSVLSPDTSFSILPASFEYSIPSDAAPTIGNEYASRESHQGAGIALGNQRLAQMLGAELVDNAKSSKLRRYSFTENGPGLVYRFYQREDSLGYWRYVSGTKEHYTAINIGLDIEPVSVQVKALPK